MHHFRNRESLQLETKGPLDWVSKADREVEQLIRDRLFTLFPEDGYLGEETGSDKLDAEGIWVVDPIDGTSCFVKGMPLWCVSIAYLLKDGSIPIGVIYQPCTDEIYVADPNNNAWLNGKPMRAQRVDSLADGIFAIGYSHRADQKATRKMLDFVISRKGQFESLGSGALMTAYVASGRYIGFYESQINSWDCLAAIALVRASGGWTNDFLADSGLLNGNYIAASAPGLQGAVAAMLQKL